jgi:hypothetical protein
LPGHRYIAGEAQTIADLAIGASLGAAERVGYPFEEYRAIQRWQADLKALPAWSRTVALHEQSPRRSGIRPRRSDRLGAMSAKRALLILCARIGFNP